MEHRFPLNKKVAVFMAVFHVGAFAAFFFTTPNRVILGLSVWAVVSSLGVGVGYHRLLTHRGFKTTKWVEYTLAVLGSLAQQGLPIIWVAIHRVHHRFTEQPGLDPHTPRDGRWWSHMDWMLHPDPRLQDKTHLKKWVANLAKQPFYRKRYIEWLPTTILALVCFVVGGIPSVLWGVAAPVVGGWHQTWFVNSGTHIWGYRWFNTSDDSRNNWIIALFTWGEGNHNSHHDDPPNPKHAVRWWEPDINWYIIWILGKLRIFKGIQKPHHSSVIT